MSKCLIITYGYFGDIFFQSSIAKKLKEESRFDVVDYAIGFPQVYRLLQNNPYINNVFLTNTPTPFPTLGANTGKDYDTIFQMKSFSFIEPPPIECQSWVEIANKSPEFEIYTEPSYDEIAKKFVLELKQKTGKPVIAIPADWKDRTFIFTKEQYDKGEDKHNVMGYGGKRRNIEYIKNQLEKYVNIITVGLPPEIKQAVTVTMPDNNQQSILFECSLMKSCDAFVGSESGMCNMASGVGTKTIITGDFVHQLYGYNGSVRKIEYPKLGPIHYFKNKGHVELNPYLSDDMVIKEILKNI